MQNFQRKYALMHYIRQLYTAIRHHLERGKSILLLGPRQTGKTTLIKDLPYAKFIQLMDSETRQKYERNPSILRQEITAQFTNCPLIIIDEIQKVPELMDVVQVLIDDKRAQFILTGSSARKIKRRSDANLLPGRVVSLRLDPVMLDEFNTIPPLDDLLFFGSLPEVTITPDIQDKESDLFSYVTSYLEEEVRAEALTRNLGAFSRFLELAASESGKCINISKLSQEIGVSQASITNYYQILEDCLIVEKLNPYTNSENRKRLTKAPKYLFFDMGVRRLAAHEGISPSRESRGHLLEHFIGLELIRRCRVSGPTNALYFWRDPSGPEVDFVLKKNQILIPIEVKHTSNPSQSDIRHITLFITEYQCEVGYIVCLISEPRQLSEKVIAIPWQHLNRIL